MCARACATITGGQLFLLFSAVYSLNNSLLLLFLREWSDPTNEIRGLQLWLQHSVEQGWPASFRSSLHCQGPQENNVTENMTPEGLTRPGPLENLVVHWKTGLHWTHSALTEPQKPQPSSPGVSLASPAAPVLTQPTCCCFKQSPTSKNAPETAHKLLGLRSHRLATLGEEILWLRLNKLVQLLEALQLLGE